MKIIINGLNNEKSDLEEILFKQEKKVTDLAMKIKTVEKNMQKKNAKIKDDEENYFRLIEIVEQQKKDIESLTECIKEMETDVDVSIIQKGNVNIKDELQLKKQIAEKDKEIYTFKLINDGQKIDIQSKFLKKYKIIIIFI